MKETKEIHYVSFEVKVPGRVTVLTKKYTLTASLENIIYMVNKTKSTLENNSE